MKEVAQSASAAQLQLNQDNAIMAELKSQLQVQTDRANDAEKALADFICPLCHNVPSCSLEELKAAQAATLKAEQAFTESKVEAEALRARLDELDATSSDIEETNGPDDNMVILDEKTSHQHAVGKAAWSRERRRIRKTAMGAVAAAEAAKAAHAKTVAEAAEQESRHAFVVHADLQAEIAEKEKQKRIRKAKK